MTIKQLPITTYKAGQLVMLEYGEYSDRGWLGPFRVTKDCDLRKLCKEYCGYEPPVHEYDSEELTEFLSNQNNGYFINLLDGFISWLTRSGYFEELDCTHIHIGRYGRIDF